MTFGFKVTCDFKGVTSRTVPVTSGVPQGSVLGPILFISYSAAVIAIVQHHGFKVHAFADDLQIKLYGSTAQSGAADLMARMSNCVESVASWMSSNRLRLNPSKTELIWLGTSRRLQHCAGLTMSVCGADVRPVECVRDLGVLIDSNMTLLNHVNSVAGICFYQLRQLRIIRRSLTTEAAHLLVRALIHTRVDYCNGLLAAGPKYLHEKLQCVLRAAARLVLQLPQNCIAHLFHTSCVDSCTGSRCQIASGSNCARSCSDASTDSHLDTCRTSARLPWFTLTSDHL